jgi:ribosomal protein S18 acetylase RimI-like enzyme
MSSFFKETPWDTKVFGIYTAELIEYSERALNACEHKSGLYTLRMKALEDKRLAEQHGFYYCDTLITPMCDSEQIKKYTHPDVSIDRTSTLEKLLNVCDGAFIHGRFYRDYNITKKQADARYNQWLGDIYEHGKVYGLIFQSELSGFIACRGHQLQLHAVSNKHRGRGLAKFWWSLVCQQLFADGFSQVSSSISASNLAALNLYASLGFKFTEATDIYHKLSK